METNEFIYDMSDDREFDPVTLTDKDFDDIFRYVLNSDMIPDSIKYKDLDVVLGMSDGDWFNSPEPIERRLRSYEYYIRKEDIEDAVYDFVDSYTNDKYEKKEKFFGKDIKNLKDEIYDFFYDYFEEKAQDDASEHDSNDFYDFERD